MRTEYEARETTCPRCRIGAHGELIATNIKYA